MTSRGGSNGAEARPSSWPLPPGLVPIGLSRVQASAYVGVSPPLFDSMVVDGRMPKPKRINRRLVWDRREIEDSFRTLDDGAGDSRVVRLPGPPGPDAPEWDDVAP